MNRMLIVFAVFAAIVHSVWAGNETIKVAESGRKIRMSDESVLPKIIHEGSVSDNPEMLPSVPILKNIHFENQVLDELGYMYPGSFLSFEVECENADYYYLHVTDDNYFEMTDDFKPTWYEELHVDEVSHKSGFEPNWGEIFKVAAYNEYGYTLSEPVFVLDYVTDESILEYIRGQFEQGQGVPPKPEIKNVVFDIENFDWETDDMSVESILSFDIDCENLSEFNIRGGRLLISDPFKYQICTPVHNQKWGSYIYDIETSRMSYHANWGESFSVKVINNYGDSNWSDPVFTTDYITDPEILARIEELYNIHTGIELNGSTSAKRYVIDGNEISFQESMADISVCNANSVVVLTLETPIRKLSLDTLQSGVYIIRARDNNKNIINIKFLKR